MTSRQNLTAVAAQLSAERKPALKPLERVRLSDQAAAALKRHIALGIYPAGARLPTENELAGQLGVTRLTIREALVQLEASGFTSTRHGSGTFVVDLAAEATLDQLADLLHAGRELDPAEAIAMMQLREIVVAGFAPAMLERVTPQQLDGLREVVAEERRGGSPEAMAALDYRFDETLAQASGNLFYLLLTRSLQPIHLRLGAIIFREAAADGLIIATQQAVIDALAAGRRLKLERVLRSYLAGGTRIIERWASSA